MMPRTLLVVMAMALAIARPGSAQTPVARLNASGEVVGAILSPRGDRIAAAVGGDRVVVWSLPDGKLLQELRFATRTHSALFASSDEVVVSLIDGSIEVRAIASGAVVRRIEAGTRQVAAAISPGGRMLATCQTEQIRLWDLASGKLLRTFGHDFGSIGGVAFSPDGTLLASAGYDANVHLWDVSTGQQRASVREQLLAAFSVAFTGDGRSLVIGGASGAIEIVDVRTASIVRRLRGEKYAVGALALSPDGRSIGAAYFDVDGMTRPAPVAVWDLASGRTVQRVVPPGASVMVSGFAADGRLLYVMAKGPELTVSALPRAAGSGPGAAGSKTR